MAVIIDSVLANPNNPVIAYADIASTATLTESSEAAGFAAENVQNSLTYNFWKPTSQNSYIEFDFGSSKTIDYIGIAGHNCGTQGNTINIYYWDGASPGSWVLIDTTAPTDDGIILFLFASSSHQIFKAEFVGGGVPSVAVIHMGARLTVERRIYGGHTPVTLAKQTVIRPQKSEGGQWLGRSIVRQGASTSVALNNLTASWFRTNFKPFMDSAITNSFFFAWRPTAYSTEVAYCWTNGDIKPSNMGQANLMQVSFKVDARLT